MRDGIARAGIPVLGWEWLGADLGAAVVEIVPGLRREAEQVSGLAVSQGTLNGGTRASGGKMRATLKACEGRHKAGADGELKGTADRGLAKLGRTGTCRQSRHQVDEACCWGGALRGRSPRTREGRIGPTAQLQWSVVSGQWIVVREGVFLALALVADWTWLRGYPRHSRVRLQFGMRST